MKKRNRMLSLIVSAAVVLSCCVFPASAAEASVTEEEMDAALRARGYPQTLLDYMAPSAKEASYSQTDLTFLSGAVTLYDMGSKEKAGYSLPLSGPMPRVQIPTADLSLIWSVGKKADGNIRVEFSYMWTNPPDEYCYEDVISVAWDPALFLIVDNSFYKVDKYDLENVYGYIIEGCVQSKEYGYKNVGAGTISWGAEITNLTRAILLYGHGEFLLEPKANDAHGKTQFYGYYVHLKTDTTVTVNLDYLGSVSINSPDDYDDRGSFTSFYY